MNWDDLWVRYARTQRVLGFFVSGILILPVSSEPATRSRSRWCSCWLVSVGSSPLTRSTTASTRSSPLIDAEALLGEDAED